jgi:hypothetical protein
VLHYTDKTNTHAYFSIFMRDSNGKTDHATGGESELEAEGESNERGVTASERTRE